MPWRERSHAANGPPAVFRLSLLVTLRVRLLLLRWSGAAPQKGLQPGFLCRMGQHLAAVRLRLDNLFIKQGIADRRERCVLWMKGALTRRRSGWSGACLSSERGRGWSNPGFATLEQGESPVSPCCGLARTAPSGWLWRRATRSDYSPFSSGSRYWSGSRSRAPSVPSCSRTSLISRKTRPGG
jgi:hypothetical protein